MTTIYLINNSLTMNNLAFPNNETLESKREKRLLSIEGEMEAKKLAKSDYMQNINVIYASPYVMSIGTAKYLANELQLDIKIDSLIGERKIGNLGDKKISMITELQESDFNYKLVGGESLNEVKLRMLKFLKSILIENEAKEIAIFTHNVAITCLLSEYCTKGFNLDNRLILNYNDDAVVDGTWHGINIIELKFDNNELVSIVRKK
ncbi:MAG: histidine phosphatase family protein [Firmicutes bacterium]|nr:histidine phosphatase family protein [Bacillota bacterium]